MPILCTYHLLEGFKLITRHIVIALLLGQLLEYLAQIILSHGTHSLLVPGCLLCLHWLGTLLLLHLHVHGFLVELELLLDRLSLMEFGGQRWLDWSGFGLGLALGLSLGWLGG